MTYDMDGNLLTWDGWTFTWNGENRLIKAEKGLLRVEADYDYTGRRFEKKVYHGETLTSHQRFLYDDYKLIEIRDALNGNALETSYTWQPLQLDVPVAMQSGTAWGYYLFDGNKNITSLRAEDGTVLAEYHYGPFGQTLSATGSWAAVNPFRFSSEYHDAETGLVYYNYRHYSPTLGRWLNRDPIEEDRGVNIYAMAGNNVIYLNDILGLWTVSGNSSVAAAYIAGGELNFNWSITTVWIGFDDLDGVHQLRHTCLNPKHDPSLYQVGLEKSIIYQQKGEFVMENDFTSKCFFAICSLELLVFTELTK